MAARTCVEQIIDIRTTLRYLGVPVVGSSQMFGDNESVVNSSEHIHTRLHKWHNALSFHRVRESIAASICRFHYIPGKINPVDILSKHWGYNCVWSLLRPLTFWSGDTADIPLELWRFNVVGEWQKIHKFCIFSEVQYFAKYDGAQRAHDVEGRILLISGNRCTHDVFGTCKDVYSYLLPITVLYYSASTY